MILNRLIESTDFLAEELAGVFLIFLEALMK